MLITLLSLLLVVGLKTGIGQESIQIKALLGHYINRTERVPDRLEALEKITHIFNAGETSQEDLILLRNLVVSVLERAGEDPYVQREGLIKIGTIKQPYLDIPILISLLYIDAPFLPQNFSTHQKRLYFVLDVIGKYRMEGAIEHIHALILHILSHEQLYPNRYDRRDLLLSALETLAQINSSKTLYFIINQYKSAPQSTKRTWVSIMTHFADFQRHSFTEDKKLILNTEEMAEISEMIQSEEMLTAQNDDFFITLSLLLALSGNAKGRLFTDYILGDNPTGYNPRANRMSYKRLKFLMELTNRIGSFETTGFIPSARKDTYPSTTAEAGDLLTLTFDTILGVLGGISRIGEIFSQKELSAEKKAVIRNRNALSAWYENLVNPYKL